MKRREFLTRSAAIAGGALCLPVWPPVLRPPKKQKPMDWMRDNKKWLFDWIWNAVPFDDFRGMQIFKTVYGIYETSLHEYYEEVSQYHIIKTKEHVDDLLLSGVFGVGGERLIEEDVELEENAHPEGSPCPRIGVNEIRFMDGFISQAGRYPTKNDKVRFVYLEGNDITRWLTRSYCGEYHQILSECRLEIK